MAEHLDERGAHGRRPQSNSSIVMAKIEYSVVWVLGHNIAGPELCFVFTYELPCGCVGVAKIARISLRICSFQLVKYF